MTEINQHFDHVKGDSRLVTIPVVDENGDPKNLSDGSARWRLEAANPVTKSTAAGTISLVRVNGASGELDALQFTIVPADTIGLTPAPYKHEAEFIDNLGNVSTVTQGHVRLKDHIIV